MWTRSGCALLTLLPGIVLLHVQVHPENSSWTCFEQSASLEVKSFFGFENAVEKLAVKHYAQSIEKGKEIIEHYVGVLQDEGVRSVEVWMDDGASGYTTTTNESPEDGDSRCQSHCESRCESDCLVAGDETEDGERRDEDGGEGDERRRSSATRISHSNSGQMNSVKSQVMSKAKNRICFIYNVINDNI